MRYSRAFIPTSKDVPKDATIASHQLLLRAGYARQVGAGIYELLPLGVRTQARIARVVRDEMNAAGAQEVLMPALLPAEYFRETGRWDLYGDVLLRLKDRKGGEYHLGPTHEEIITDMVRREVKSYRQLPLNLYQIQVKFRDEPRPRAGLLRCREFLMKDAYSFDVDEAGALASYAQMRDAYHRIFKRLGLAYRVVEADSGSIGGKTSAEFQVLAQSGEDAIVACPKCDYAANVEVAEAAPEEPSTETPSGQRPTKIHTPGAGGIDDVVKFVGGGLTPKKMLKCLVYATSKGLAMAVVRGDDDVNEIKLAKALGVAEVHLATESDVRKATGASLGFAGPVGLNVPNPTLSLVIADRAVEKVVDAVTGANESDHHLTHVNFGRDFTCPVADLRQVRAGDRCPRCQSPLEAYRGIEGGHVFVLGTVYSGQMKAVYLDKDGAEKPIVMGCYGIGVSRLVAAAIEQHHDENGIAWPLPIAPYHVIVVPLGKDEAVQKAAEELYAGLREKRVDVLLDDRDERPGVKLKDADLLGIPLRVVIGGKSLAGGNVELKARTAKDAELIPVADALDVVQRRVVEGGGTLLAQPGGAP